MNTLLNYLANHPTIGIIGAIKVFIISTIEISDIDLIGHIFQNLGYIFGGLLAFLTFCAWVDKNIIKPFFKSKK
jgi:hypothetical protein